ncbi:MAG TPA: hypothetical protein VFV77_03660 [Gammaproteobacteria bacterium]|nr:hypothetical protein [Gammaproteobacteria bacterium]
MLRKQRRNLPSLHTEELAIIAPLDTHGEPVAEAKIYAKVADLGPRSMSIRSDSPVTPGEVLDISLSLQGQNGAHSLKGIARTVSACDNDSCYVVGIELLPEDQPAKWRHQFH